MSSSKFAACLAVTLAFEGGYSVVRADPGNWTGGKVGKGELRGTMKGIAASSHPTLDIKNLTDSQVAAIYASEYWQPVRGEELPNGVDLATFDFAVNSGISRSAKALQKAVMVAADGRVGPTTIAATQDMAKISAAVVVDRIFDARLSFLQGLSTWKTFGKGWGRRVGEVKGKALLMAGASAELVIELAAEQRHKATTDAKNSKGAVAGGAASGGGAVVTQTGGIDWLQFGALAVAAVVLIGCGIILYRRANARREMAAAMVAVVAK